MVNYNSSDEESTTILTQDMLGDSFGDKTDKLTSDMKEEFQNAKDAMEHLNMSKMNQGQEQGVFTPPPANQRQESGPLTPPSVNQGQEFRQQPPFEQFDASYGRTKEKTSKKKGGGTIAYVIISLVLICGLAGLCVWGYLHYDKKIKNLNDEKDNLKAELEVSQSENSGYISEISEKDAAISDLNTQVADAQANYGRYDTIVNYLNTYGISGGYLDYFISAKEITVKTGEEETFTIYVENPDNGIYYEQTSSDIAWIETTSDAYDGNPNIKGFTVHGFLPGTVTVSLIATETNEIINLTIHVLE